MRLQMLIRASLCNYPLYIVSILSVRLPVTLCWSECPHCPLCSGLNFSGPITATISVIAEGILQQGSLD